MVLQGPTYLMRFPPPPMGIGGFFFRRLAGSPLSSPLSPEENGRCFLAALLPVASPQTAFFPAFSPCGPDITP